MKLKKQILLALCAAATYGLAACGGDGHDHDDDHKGHNHGKGEGDKEHDHVHIEAGPNGGRILKDFEPHAEFFVTEDRKVQISFLGDDDKLIPPAEQEVKVVAGDRTAQTKLTFAKSGNVLISNEALPAGDDFPIVVQIKANADAKSVNEPFNLDLAQCPTCENKEYACECEHGDHE